MKANKRLQTALAAGAVAVGLLLGASAAQAENIDFGTTDNDLSSPYIEDGFEFTVLNDSPSVNQFAITGESGNPPGALATRQEGQGASQEAGVSIKHTSGQLFTFDSFELSRAPEGSFSDGIAFFGFVGGSFTESFDGLDSRNAIFQRRAPSNWDPIDELQICCVNAGNSRLLLDNMQLTAVVPVPAAVWLFGSGLVAFGAAARRRKQTTATA